jgi:polyhydroxyalkanoate synthesis regulator phasin
MAADKVALGEFVEIAQKFADSDVQTKGEIDSLINDGTLSAEEGRVFRSLLTPGEGVGGDVDRTIDALNRASDNIGNATDVARSIQGSLQEINGRLTGVTDSLDRQMAAVRVENVEHANRFEKFVSVVKERMERVGNLVETLSKKPDLTQADLMHIQYEIMEMGIVLDVASKVGDKGSQLLQTLFRGQN